MPVELINTGSELMLGRVLNTHQEWLCHQLSDRGYVVTRQVAVPDTGLDIKAAVRESLTRCDVVIVTGGLGPTSDDLTRDFIAQLLGRPLREDGAILARLQGYFAKRGRPMPERTKVQAQVPAGAEVLENDFGTAPGLAVTLSPNPYRSESHASHILMLPGPPRELRPMFLRHVVPWLARNIPAPAHFVCRTLRMAGLGESVLEERIAGPLQTLVAKGLELGYCARPGQVDVRLVCRGEDAETMVAEAETIVGAHVGAHFYAVGEEEIESVIVRMLTARRETLALAESCTGGCISHRITNVPGASAVLLAGLVTYSNEAKVKFLGVQPATLAAHGAVSEPVAREMAEGARRATGATYAIAVTGIAGPAGGSPDKPTGTVYIALAGGFPTVAVRNLNSMDRESFKALTAQQALDLLRRKLGTAEAAR